jgi:hypothetical protein
VPDGTRARAGAALQDRAEDHRSGALTPLA